MNAANDTTEPTTIPAASGFDAPLWRVWRGMSAMRVVSLVNAGKRGSACDEFAIYDASEETLDAIAPSVLWAVCEGASVATMRALFEDAAQLGAKFSASTARGIDVPKCPDIKVEGEMVRGYLSETTFGLTFSFWIGGKPGGLKHDESVYAHKHQDAAKAYAWASDQANRARLVTMSRSDFYREMSAIGVRIS